MIASKHQDILLMYFLEFTDSKKVWVIDKAFNGEDDCVAGCSSLARSYRHRDKVKHRGTRKTGKGEASIHDADQQTQVTGVLMGL